MGARHAHGDCRPNPSATANQNANAHGDACSDACSDPGAHAHRHACAQGGSDQGEIEGWVERIEGDLWTIGGHPVRVTGATKFIRDRPGIGWKVTVEAVREADGSLTALTITGDVPPATPEPYECTDIVEAKNGDWWTICGELIGVRGATIEGDPQIGDLVSVVATRGVSGIQASSIVAIPLTVFEFEGIISAVSGSSVVVDGYTVLINSLTQIIGTPAVGRVAQVRAVKMPDNSLLGKVVMVLDPTPTPTETATLPPTPTATSTLEPTSNSNAGANSDLHPGADANSNAGANSDLHPGADANSNAGANSDLHLGADAHSDAGANIDLHLGADAHLDAGADVDPHLGADAPRPRCERQLRRARSPGCAARRSTPDRAYPVEVGVNQVTADTQHNSSIIPLRSQRRAPGRFWRARALLAALLAVMLAAATCPRPVNATQQDPGQAATTRAEGVLQAKGPGKWKVGKLDVLLDNTTVVMQKRGKAEPGAWVIVWGQQSRAGEMRAGYLQVDRPASLSGPTIQLSGMLRKQTSSWWMVEQTPIEITPDTVISGQPVIGALVWVVALQQGDALLALAAEVLAPDPDIPIFEFEGTITALADGSWRVDDYEVLIDQLTDIIGEPGIGTIAEVQAGQLADGRLLARTIRVVDPTAEASLNTMVADIIPETGNTERWEVIVFPKSPWADPTLATLHVSFNTYVDESRTTAQTGVWAEMRGAPLGSEEYQADVIRLEQPLPVSITGAILPPPTTPAPSGWGQINGQPVWLGAVEPGMATAQAMLGSSVAVTGVRLGNGVIWAKQVRSVEP